MAKAPHQDARSPTRVGFGETSCPGPAANGNDARFNRRALAQARQSTVRLNSIDLYAEAQEDALYGRVEWGGRVCGTEK
jgi:hypothetical protein